MHVSGILITTFRATYFRVAVHIFPCLVYKMFNEETLNLINVSSMNSEQRKLCVQSPIEIDTRFLRK